MTFYGVKPPPALATALEAMALAVPSENACDSELYVSSATPRALATHSDDSAPSTIMKALRLQAMAATCRG